MAFLEKSWEQLEVERVQEREELERAREATRELREHEYRVAKLEYATQPRYKSIERVISAIAKAPAMGIVAICVTVLAAKGVKIPECLSKYLTV